MKGVNFIHINQVESGELSNTQIKDNRLCARGKWITARPEGYRELKHRIKAAWLVFSGKADVFYFDGDQ